MYRHAFAVCCDTAKGLGRIELLRSDIGKQQANQVNIGIDHALVDIHCFRFLCLQAAIKARKFSECFQSALRIFNFCRKGITPLVEALGKGIRCQSGRLDAAFKVARNELILFVFAEDIDGCHDFVRFDAVETGKDLHCDRKRFCHQRPRIIVFVFHHLSVMREILRYETIRFPRKILHVYYLFLFSYHGLYQRLRWWSTKELRNLVGLQRPISRALRLR